MIGDRLLGQLITGLVAIVLLGAAFFWFKSSYERSVIAEHEAKAQKVIKAEEIKDAAKTETLVAAVAKNRTAAKATQSKIAVAGKADAVANPVDAGCRLSATGVQLVNDSIRESSSAELLHDPVPKRDPAGDRIIARSNDEAARRSATSTTGVPGATSMPNGMDQSSPEKPSLKARLKTLWGK